MGFRYLTLFIALLSLPLSAEFSPKSRINILNLSVQKNVQEALKEYLLHYQETNSHDFFVLRKISENCLHQGFLSNDPYIQKSSILGASLSGSCEGLDILKKTMETEDPFLQLMAIGSLHNYLGSTIEDLLIKAMSSPYPIIRLEAAYKLALLKNPAVVDHLYSFLNKLPPEARALTAAIFIMLETEEADAYVREFLSSPNPAIRAYTITLIGEHHKARFLPSLRSLSGGAILPIEREALLFSLGNLRDSSSYPFIKKSLTLSSTESILAAVAAAKIGKEEEALPILEKGIISKNSLAVAACSYLSANNAEKLLLPLFSTLPPSSQYQRAGIPVSSDEDLRINAAFVLAKARSQSEVVSSYLKDFFTCPTFGRQLLLSHSPGKSLSAFHWSHLPVSNTQSTTQTSLRPENALLDASFLLPKEYYLSITESLLSHHEGREFLALQALSLLSQKKDSAVLEILEKASQIPGKPLLRAYADLHIYRITGNPSVKDRLRLWLKDSSDETLILKDNEEIRNKVSSTCLKYEVIPELKTKILLEILETLVTAKNKEDILLLVHLMTDGKGKNLPFLAGLLAKISE
ncbi:HEAT repeat domain-containing protein [Chlamydiifrater phoenicopteri]|uniref:HEAT repeat domain-containing protein n=1 Tax=Chlamydiifrater phoenicopteri TaxID=2681469 RepID=UPI001BCC719D|nr:HEAT repeat domain-containing protein [Chlamydiifrater phoenicopteri]